MKKIILSLAAATLLFAGCTKETTTSEITGTNPNTIGFDLSTGKTRATINTTTKLEEATTGFTVFATKSNGEESPAQVVAIDNKAYKYVTDKWGWVDAEDEWQQWPEETKYFPMNFYAYYPAKGDTDYATELGLGDALTETYTILAADKQQDLLAANQLNVMTRPSSSSVDLNFKHILSQVKFKLVVGTNLTAKIQSIAIKSVAKSNAFSYASLTWPAAASLETTNLDHYSYLAIGDESYSAFTSVVGDSSTAYDITNTNGALMLMPQETASIAWDDKSANAVTTDLNTKSYIEVVYRMYQAEPYKDVVGFARADSYPDWAAQSQTSTAADAELFVKVAYSLSAIWEMGKAYTYTLYLGTPDASGGNLIDPDFVDPSGGDTDLPVVDPSTGGDIDPTDPIVDTDKPIGFIVEVDDWGNPTNNDVK
jgi:hypothetical protein